MSTFASGQLAPGPPPPTSRRSAWIAIAAAAAVAAAVAARAGFLMRPLCWPWGYRDPPIADVVSHLLPGAALWLAGAALLRGEVSRRRAGAAVGLFVAATFALELGTLHLDGRGFDTLRLRVEHVGVTSYFTDAESARGVGALLRDFPPPGLHLHSRTHPPGPILYYWLLLHVFPPARAAWIGGALIGLAAAATAALVHRFARLWTDEPRARATAAALWPLMPAVVGFLPEFDQVYPAFTIGIVLGWRRALAGDRRAALLTGALAGVALFFAWNLLLLGAFVVMATLWHHFAAPGEDPRWRTTLRALALAATGFAAVTMLPELASGYHPLHALAAALGAQAGLGIAASCPWCRAIVSGPWDLFLTTGALPVVLWLAAVVRALAARGPRDEPGAMTLLGAATVGVVAISARLPQETARVWLFLLPFAIAPAGVALARLPAAERRAALAAQLLVLAVVVARLDFIGLD